MFTFLLALFALTQAAKFAPHHLRRGELTYVSTPVGYRPIQCVLKPEEDNHIITNTEDDSGTWVEYPDSNRKVFYPALQECIENAKMIQRKLYMKRKYAENPKLVTPNLGDGWQIYGGYYPPNLMGTFTSLHNLPNEDMTDEGQIMYYFIGMQNNDNRGNVTIIQPVITYCESGCSDTEKGSTLPGWSGNSWNCCPSGQTWFSTPIQLKAGDTGINGSMITDSVAGTITVITQLGNAISNLTLTNDYRDYDWIDVTLEAYDYGSHCDAFNSMPFDFVNMKITEADGTPVNSPPWQIVNNSFCGGTIMFSDGGLAASIIGNAKGE